MSTSFPIIPKVGHLAGLAPLHRGSWAGYRKEKLLMPVSSICLNTSKPIILVQARGSEMSYWHQDLVERREYEGPERAAAARGLMCRA
jgi:hypothetical protein